MLILLLSIIAIETALIGVLVYAAFNLNRKNEVYESWLARFRSRLDETYAQLKSVDERNLFEKDDDVGFVFSELIRIMKEFDEEIK
jgi:hypothetical protein